MQSVMLINSNAFKMLITKKGFTQRSLANSACISDTTLNLLINCKRTVSATTASKIRSALGCEFDDIFFIVNDCKSDQSYRGDPAAEQPDKAVDEQAATIELPKTG